MSPAVRMFAVDAGIITAKSIMDGGAFEIRQHARSIHGLLSAFGVKVVVRRLFGAQGTCFFSALFFAGLFLFRGGDMNIANGYRPVFGYGMNTTSKGRDYDEIIKDSTLGRDVSTHL